MFLGSTGKCYPRNLNPPRQHPTSSLPLPAPLAATVCVLGALIILGSTLWVGRENVRTGRDDFLSFYAGARLTGSARMYDPDAIARLQIQVAGAAGPRLMYIRPPCFALFLWPLAQLPYGLAHGVWLALRLAAAIAFVFLWPYSNRTTAAMVCCWSVPLAAGLANAQDAPFLLLWLALAERLQQSGKPIHAGAVLCLCLAKFHLFLLLPLLFVMHRRWRVVSGFVAGCGLLGVLSFLAAGWDWPARYRQVLSLTQIVPLPWMMPNIHGLLPAGPIEWCATLAVVLATVFVVSRFGYRMGLAAALTGSLLVSYHAYVQDAVILIPAILIVLEDARGLAVRYTALALATPIPWVLLLARRA